MSIVLRSFIPWYLYPKRDHLPGKHWVVKGQGQKGTDLPALHILCTDKMIHFLNARGLSSLLGTIGPKGPLVSGSGICLFSFWSISPCQPAILCQMVLGRKSWIPAFEHRVLLYTCWTYSLCISLEQIWRGCNKKTNVSSQIQIFKL